MLLLRGRGVTAQGAGFNCLGFTRTENLGLASSYTQVVGRFLAASLYRRQNGGCCCVRALIMDMSEGVFDAYVTLEQGNPIILLRVRERRRSEGMTSLQIMIQFYNGHKKEVIAVGKSRVTTCLCVKEVE